MDVLRDSSLGTAPKSIVELDAICIMQSTSTANAVCMFDTAKMPFFVRRSQALAASPSGCSELAQTRSHLSRGFLGAELARTVLRCDDMVHASPGLAKKVVDTVNCPLMQYNYCVRHDLAHLHET